MIEQIKKRDGRIVLFDKNKIAEAIWKAAKAIGGKDRELSAKLADQVVESLERQLRTGEIPTVEQVQDLVEKTLVENGHYKTAKAYILYRQKRAEARRACAILGVKDDLKLPLNTIVILAARYLKRNESREITETTSQLFMRVAKAIARVEKNYGKSEEEIKALEKKFYELMKSFTFLPNSPTLMNAGVNTKLTLSACFVLPIEDDMRSIFNALKLMALVQQAGGGTGFSFSKLRPKGDIVRPSCGIASGPISFMKIFDAATEQIKQGGRRRGASMGLLRVDHPDILDFVVCKEREGVLRNFNLSVGVTDDFMKAVEADKDFDLVNPRTGEVVKTIKARVIWNLIATMAWKNGEPGIIFLDTINRFNPTPHVGEIEAVNPCGEQPLLPYESCNLGSINLSKFVNDGEINWEELREVVRFAVRFLDDVIDANTFPAKEIEEATKANRKIGLGVMGFADMLIKLGIPYNSQQALEIAEKVMSFITDEAIRMSEELGEERGSFPNFNGSVWEKRGYKHMRNATLTTIAPTGTISEIAGCSQGIEPLFAIAYIRNVKESLGYDLTVINPLFELKAVERGIYSDQLIKQISRATSIQQIKEVPDDMRRVFVTAFDVLPEWHVKMQAAFQNYTHNSISKTVNLPNHATPANVEKIFMQAWKLGCKGITVYRFSSREVQVLKPIREVSPGFACEVCS